MTTSLDALRDHLPPGLSELAAESFALALLDSAHVVLVVLDGDRRVRFVNQHFTDLCGHAIEDLVGRDWFEVCIPPAHRPSVDEIWKQAIGGEPTRAFVNAVHCREGGVRWFQWYDRIIQDPRNGGPVLLAIGHDVTERERALLEQSQVVEAVFQASNVCLAYLDRDFDFVRVNRAYAATDGKAPEDFLGRNHFEMYPHAENREIFTRVRDTGVPHVAFAKPFEYAQNPERGVTHWDWTLSPAFTANGDVGGVVLALTDVTTRIVAMEELRTSENHLEAQLKEKEILLREVHHRVKNNLQIISSLLYLQTVRAPDSSSRQVLADSRNRIQAIALVHELLYRSQSLGNIDLRSYLEGLGTAARASYGTEATIEVEVRDDTPALDISDAVPCGLIVSELFSNACKHAFVGRDPGAIRIEAHGEVDGSVTVQVTDDGIGLPHACVDQQETLGLTLVGRLTEQLNGELTVAVDRGTRYSLRFHPGGSRRTGPGI